MKVFPGATVKHLSHYILPTLEDDCPDTVIIHVGINDLLYKGKFDDDDVHKLAKEIVNIDIVCKESGVQNIFIYGITYYKSRCKHDKKSQQSGKCFMSKISVYYKLFINIKNEDTRKVRRIHLDNHGTNILANNFANSLNILNNFLYIIETRPPLPI